MCIRCGYIECICRSETQDRSIPPDEILNNYSSFGSRSVQEEAQRYTNWPPLIAPERTIGMPNTSPSGWTTVSSEGITIGSSSTPRTPRIDTAPVTPAPSSTNPYDNCTTCNNYPCLCVNAYGERLVNKDRREQHSCTVPTYKHPSLIFWPEEKNKDSITSRFINGKHKLNKLSLGLPRRYCSVELEVGGILDVKSLAQNNIIDNVLKWGASVTKDGSLPSTGFEICTSPARAGYFINQINDICEILKRHKAWVNYKCGLHVHIDSRDLTSAQILRLVQVYSKIENALFAIVPDSRRNNGKYADKNYCEKCSLKLSKAMDTYFKNPKANIYWGVPEKNRRKLNKCLTRKIATHITYSTLGQKTINANTSHASKPKEFSEYRIAGERARVTGQKILAFTKDHYSTSRYYALNLHSHFYKDKGGKGRGTIECRLAGGTIDPGKIIPWVQLWDQILYVTTAWKTDDINNLPKDQMEALLTIAPNEEVRNWIIARKEKFKNVKASPSEDF